MTVSLPGLPGLTLPPTWIAQKQNCENKYKKLWVQSTYLQKNEDVTQAPAEGNQTNHETNAQSDLASPSSLTSISDSVPGVNGENATQTASSQALRETATEAQPGTLEWVQELNDLGAGKQKAVDTETQSNYDNINKQGGIANAGTQERSLYSGGDGRNTQTNSQGETPGSTENGRRNVQSGYESRLYGRSSQEALHSSDSEGRELTPEQATKLQGTAVADNNGAPLAVYHITDNMEFTTFAKGDTGFHFGSMDQALQHGQKRKYAKGRIFRAYLNIKNPIMARMDIMGWHAGGTALLLWSDGILTDSEMQEVTEAYRIGDGYDSAAAVRLREILEDKGYDGIAYPNGFEGDGMSYMAFRDNQIVRSEISPFGADKNTTPTVSYNENDAPIYVQEVRTNGKNMETNTDGNGQSSSGANYEGQAGNAERKGHDLGGIHSDRGVEGNGGAGDTRQIQQSGSSAGYGSIESNASVDADASVGAAPA